MERASVLLFWLSATIDPYVDTVQVGFPYIMPVLMEHNRKAANERAAKEAAKVSASKPPPPQESADVAGVSNPRAAVS